MKEFSKDRLEFHSMVLAKPLMGPWQVSSEALESGRSSTSRMTATSPRLRDGMQFLHAYPLHSWIFLSPCLPILLPERRWIAGRVR